MYVYRTLLHLLFLSLWNAGKLFHIFYSYVINFCMLSHLIITLTLLLTQIKENIPQEKNRFEHLENRNKELTSEIEKLHKDLEEVVQRYEDEIKLLKNRVVSNTKEQQNASDHFKGLMSTNDQLQKQLQNLQESLGRKDFQIQNFTAERYVLFITKNRKHKKWFLNSIQLLLQVFCSF